MPTFSIANINPGLVRCELANSLLALQEADIKRFLERLTHTDDQDPDPVRLDHIWLRLAGPYLDAARNTMVAGFVECCHSDYLLMIDSDVAPKVEDYYRLVETAHRYELGCLSGVYYSPQPGNGHGIGPVVFHWGDKTRPLDGLKPWTIEDLEKLDPNVPVMAEVVGAGFLCLSRRLLLEMRDKYEPPMQWFVEQIVDGVFQGEDTGLCYRLADWSDDCRPHILPGLVANHHKNMPLGR